MIPACDLRPTFPPRATAGRRNKNADSLLTTQYRNRHDTKLHLAGFLCTNFTLPPPPPSHDGITVPLAPRLPHALRLPNPKALKPVYYLP